MSSNNFGKYLKAIRIARRITLREFCERYGFDPGNYSRIERGRFPAPSEEKLEKYAVALGIERGSDQWIEFFDLASVSRGELPGDLMADEELLEKLPALFRTLRGTPVSPENLDALVEDVRRS